MKKTMWIVLGLFMSSVCVWAASSDIKMVTYFPTPYMIYQDVQVSGPADIGVGTSAKLKVQKMLQMQNLKVQ